MKRYTNSAVLQAVISISWFSCFSLPSLAAEPFPSPEREQRAWTETHLRISPSMQEKIDRTSEFLKTQAPRLRDNLDELKWMGYLDRRTKASIETTVADARQSMSGLVATEQGGYLDAGRARMIAYELGMAGDVLAEQSKKIRANLIQKDKQIPAVGNTQQVLAQYPMEISEMLATMSGYLHETAKAIVRNLK